MDANPAPGWSGLFRVYSVGIGDAAPREPGFPSPGDPNMDTSQLVSVYISKELLGQPDPLGNDEDLLGYPEIDSLGIVGLVTYLEQEFGIAIPPEDVVLENFRTVGAIASYVDGRSPTG